MRAASDASEFGGSGIVALEEEVVHLAVGVGVEEHGARGLAVASGAADLLVVGFDAAGKRGVDDGADVGFVDAHAEGDGGDDDLELAGEEVALDAFAHAGFETGVIGGGACRRGRRRVLRRLCGWERRRWRDGLRADLSRLAVNSLRRGFDISTTSMARLWRRKPWMKSAGL